ncbi:aminotransferase class III-fold pyridoxal phosphate-dependent enzyme [Cellulosimicrobium marinum]|uniref:aminotransferase class III-fold pyridoxal phosphate-dependent enzyme n=1 Tax=Cellulosimicrobium marinum TaxID=1638992 RepID=UPI001E3A1307|nr:aminotransferase class III-fold pyridoxal phosphate-dependent enzyme [Cellulosimicrobium marinum]MCB7135712.1 aminotransferase class III-fold pyridoxal phosphate-dependent enzyme [Cellulosimicrobium marinum]
MSLAIDARRPSRLSVLDESPSFGDGLTLVSADNASVVLRTPDQDELVVTDLMSSYASTNFGHGNPEIATASTTSSDLVAPFRTSAAEDVAHWLCARLDESRDRRVLFQIGGSFAVATAVSLARRHRPGKVVVVTGAFHGLGVDTGAFSSVQREYALQDTGFQSLVAHEVVRLDPGVVPTDWSDVSCFLYEPVQGASGYVPLDREWLRAVSTAARTAGVVLIADEIQSGYFRHGHLSLSAAWGLDPDVVLFAKSLTNGMYPLSAVVYDASIEERHAGPRLAHTFQTGTLGPAAALQVARFVDSHDVEAMCRRVATSLRLVARVLEDEGRAAEIHVPGPSLSFRPVGRTGQEVARRALELGVLVFPGGARGERVRVAPPLTIPDDQLRAGLDTLRHAIR